MYWLGIDIGSISTDMVLMDDNNDIIRSLYLKTGSRPADAVQDGLKKLGGLVSSADISGVGVTGSGRHIGAAVAGADVVKNEITAHGRAVAEIDPQIRTVIEIGGQDSKIIIMKDGMVEDFAMNTVCAAGTGSFLDRQAGRMGISIEALSHMAYKAKRAEPITGRCAVFAESDMIHKQQVGAREEELMAGLCRALVRSYMSNVAKGKRILPRVCFQGGVASNEGMRKAFEEALGNEVFVPAQHKVMGALGAALLAKEKNPAKTRFNGFEAGNLKLSLREHGCTDCSNSCKITLIKSPDGVQGCFGDICGKYSSGYSRYL